MDGAGSRDRESMHMHGQVLRSSAEPETEDEHDHDHERERESLSLASLGKEEKRASVIQEFKRQSGVFFDDFEEGEEDTGVSEDDVAVAEPTPEVDGHDKQE